MHFRGFPKLKYRPLVISRKSMLLTVTFRKVWCVDIYSYTPDKFCVPIRAKYGYTYLRPSKKVSFLNVKLPSES